MFERFGNASADLQIRRDHQDASIRHPEGQGRDDAGFPAADGDLKNDVLVFLREVLSYSPVRLALRLAQAVIAFDVRG